MIVPFLLMSMLVGSALNLETSFFVIAFVTQLVVLVTIPLLLLLRGRWRRILLPQYYYYMNLALLVGYCQFSVGHEEYWTRTPRRFDG
jgi:hypothetical protein